MPLGETAVVTPPPVPDRDLGQIGILHPELNATLWTLVELVPEAERPFLDEANVAGAVRAVRRVELVDWHTFGSAACIVGREVAITTDAVQRGKRGGGGGRNRWRSQRVGQGRRRGRNGRCFRYRDR